MMPTLFGYSPPATRAGGRPTRSSTPRTGDVFVSSAPQFGRSNQPVFITPMVVDNVPAFDPDNLAVVQQYLDLMEVAKSYSRPDISGRKVGIAVIGGSGRVYLGTNVEVDQGEAAWTIHAEPFALALARKYGEKTITRMIQSLQPCAQCRQVIREVGHEDLPLTFIEQDASKRAGKADANSVIFTHSTIGELFPDGYSYATPRLNMMNHPLMNLEAEYIKPSLAHPLTKAAWRSANQSYLPNKRKAWAAIVAELSDGSIYSGDVITVSGPNATIVPVMTLLAKIIGDGRSPAEIQQAVLMEPKDADYRFYNSAKGVLQEYVPDARLRRVQLRPGDDG